MENTELSLPEFIAFLQMRGKYSFSLDEIPTKAYASRKSLLSMVQRLIKEQRLFSPYKRFYTIVPLEHKVAGSIPALWYSIIH
ncbi:hypothetical protein [Rickettsia endosymbiont of Aspidapion aeneum]|uniref:hypothetical protein n=1 Tax=Rickettsia endosymbiont of Aspidapion aeneum TaxID=3066247 RepID=UPI00313BBCF7